MTALYVLIGDYVIPPNSAGQVGRNGSPTRSLCVWRWQVLLGSKHHWGVRAAASLITLTTLYLATRSPSWADDLRLFDATTPVLCGTARHYVIGIPSRVVTRQKRECEALRP